MGLWLVMALVVILPCLRYVEQSFERIPSGIQRNEVGKILPHFSSKPVELNDIPDAWQPKEQLKRPYQAVERYTFLVEPFSFYCIFDTQDMLLLKIPTYE